MRLRLIVLAGSLLLIALAGYSCKSADHTLPDYSKWQNETSTELMIHNGKEESMPSVQYFDIDEKKLIFRMVSLLNHENKEPWLLFYLMEPADQNKDIELNLFEYKNGKWVFIKNFSDHLDPTVQAMDFLKVKYGLEVK